MLARKEDLRNAYPIVAKALGNKFKVNVRIGGSQASTDGNTVFLPAIEPKSEADRNALWGYLAHESAHVRWTDQTVFRAYAERGPIYQRVLNRVEDARIESALARLYPGTRSTIDTALGNMIERGLFGELNETWQPAMIFTGYILYATRVRTLKQETCAYLLQSASIALNKAFGAGFVARLDALLDEVKGLGSTDEATKLSDRIMDLVAQQQLPQPDPDDDETDESQDSEAPGSDPADDDETDEPQGSNASESDPADDDEADESQDSNASESDTGDDDETDEPQGSEASESDAGDDDEADGSQGSNASESDTGDDDEADESQDSNASESDTGDDDETDEPQGSEASRAIFSADESDMAPDPFDGIKQAINSMPESKDEELPELVLNDESCNAGLALYRKVVAESCRLRAQLHGLVQSERMEHNAIRKSGRWISGRHLCRAATHDARIFRHRGWQTAINTAVHLLIDRSGSMCQPVLDQTRLSLTIEAAMALALALEGMDGVTSAVTAFPGDASRKDQVLGIMRRSERVKSVAKRFPIAPEGGTPLTGALWYCAAELLLQSQKRRIIIVLTDGQPNDRVSTATMLSRCAKSGIEVIGIGLQYDVSALFENSLNITDFRDLKRKLFTIAKELLVA